MHFVSEQQNKRLVAQWLAPQTEANNYVVDPDIANHDASMGWAMSGSSLVPNKNRKRKVISKTSQLLNCLPESIRFIGRPDVYSEEFFAQYARQQKHQINSEEDTATYCSSDIEALNAELAPNETRIGLFAIQLDLVSLKNFMLLRKLVPRKDYILIKNRISARFNRSRKKNQLDSLKHFNRKLMSENQRLKRLVAQQMRDRRSGMLSPSPMPLMSNDEGDVVADCNDLNAV